MEEHEWKFIPRLTVLDSTDEDGSQKWIHFKEKKKKKKFGSVSCFVFLFFFSWFLFILAGTMRSSRGLGNRGNGAFQVDWKVKWRRRRVSFLIVSGRWMEKNVFFQSWTWVFFGDDPRIQSRPGDPFPDFQDFYFLEK